MPSTILGDYFTRKKSAEQGLISILDSIDSAILITDENTVVCYVNDAFTRVFGTKPERIIGKSLNNLRLKQTVLLPDVIKSGKRINGFYRPDAECFLDAIPIIVDNKIIGGIATGKDVKEICRLNDELQRNVKKYKSLVKTASRAYEAKYTFKDIIAESEIMQEALNLAMKGAKGESNILITGESGTGKEMVAQAIHNYGKRSNGKFVAVNCAAIAPSLVESELFGYEEGAFTGAKKGGKIGFFEITAGGTIFLDEIGELSLDIQAKLLRAIQERTIRKVGATNEIPFDARVIAATNKDLKERIREGNFREDLYYRINVVNIHLPPLRQRKGDIQLLAQAYLQRYSQNNNRRYEFADEINPVFLQYTWPGNIRELCNVIEHAINVCDGEDRILVSHLPDSLQSLKVKQNTGKLSDLIQEYEKQILLTYLNKYGRSVNAKKQIANELGISLATLYKKLDTIKNE
ncbi:MAG: sigma 54-interacting transcriptional regulator [Firmicutes bacterium]|nr:sigma 54-interacting transcriptional regulator [Bacillota bacterium]